MSRVVGWVNLDLIWGGRLRQASVYVPQAGAASSGHVSNEPKIVFIVRSFLPDLGHGALAGQHACVTRSEKVMNSRKVGQLVGTCGAYCALAPPTRAKATRAFMLRAMVCCCARLRW